MMIHQGIGTTWGSSPAIRISSLGTKNLYGSSYQQTEKGTTAWNANGRTYAITHSYRWSRNNTRSAPLDLYIQFLAATTSHRLNLQPLNWDVKKGSYIGHINWINAITTRLPNIDLQDR
jgi:hypothetical protein